MTPNPKTTFLPHRLALLILAALAVGTSAFAAEPEVVSRAQVIESCREFRIAVKLISGIHTGLMQASILEEGVAETEIAGKNLAAYQKARKHLERSVELNPYFVEPYVFLANSYWEIENDLDKTIEFYDKALALDPDYDDVISTRGQVFVLLEKADEAEKDLKRLEKLNSEHAASLRQQIAELRAK